MTILMAILCFCSLFRYAGSNEVQLKDPKLANIFELYDLLADRAHKLFAHPAIVDNPEEALKDIGIINEKTFLEEMHNFARDYRPYANYQRENATGTAEIEIKPEDKKSFTKIKYPNTNYLLLHLLLLNVINKVDIQNEIQNDLESIWAEKNANELRLRQKHLFKFGFIINCIYAYFMDDRQNIHFSEIRTATTTKVEMVKQHPFYAILTKNKCANEDVIRIFVNLIITEIEENSDINVDVHHFFLNNIKKKFVILMTNETKMNGKLEEEYAELQKDPYFPEKLPKILNLWALLEVLPEIMLQIIVKIGWEGYENHLKPTMWQILLRINIKILEVRKMLIYSHYKRAISKMPDEKLRTKLETISKNDKIFNFIFDNDIKYNYRKWFNHLKVHIAKFLAKKYFDLSGDFHFHHVSENDEWKVICYNIGRNILQKILSQNGVEGNMTAKEKEKKKYELLVQLHFRFFCVGIRQMDSIKQVFEKRIISGQTIFHSYMVSELLKIVPGAMKKFNEIIGPKEKLAKENPQEEENLFFDAVSEVRSEICEKQLLNENHESMYKTILSFIKSFFGFH